MEATTNDVLAEIEGEEQRQREMQAAQIARERQQNAEYRAKVVADAAELRGRLNESLDELGDLVPRLLLACLHFDRVAAEVQEKGLGFDPGAHLLEDVFCVPPTFGRDLKEAILTLAPRTEWDFDHTGILGKGVKAERPRLKGPIQIRTPRFWDDMAPPPGFVGVWDRLRGRPMEEPGPIGPVLPF